MVPLIKQYLGEKQRRKCHFHLLGYHHLGQAFPGLSANDICSSSLDLRPRTLLPATPLIQRSQGLTYQRFGLFPFRSPLLRESHLLSLPEGTKMFQFTSSDLLILWIQIKISPIREKGFPIRKSRNHRLFAPPPCLSQLATSFIVFKRQIIHQRLLVA